MNFSCAHEFETSYKSGLWPAVLLECVKRLAMIGQSPLIIYLPILSRREGPSNKDGPGPTIPGEP